MMNNNNVQVSRRDVIRWSALASSTVLVAACAGSSSNSDSHPNDAGDANAAAIPLLNALLTAEWGAIAAYAAGAGILAAPPAGDALAASAPVYLAVATHFKSQHFAHATALVSAIDGLDGTPVKQSSVTFAAPSGFTGTVTNVLKLAANAEKAAAVAYNATVPQLPVTDELRFLAGSILGDETQHFVFLYALLQGLAVAGPNVSTDSAQIAPTDFTSTVGSDVGLQSVADFTYT
jgi:bacterioferritin (cytochrome b1)